MTDNDMILKKLEDIEAQIAPLIKASNMLNELREDLIPIGNQATAILINELQEVESGFQLDDLFVLLKHAMRNTNNFVFVLKQMSSIIEFLTDLEPLLKSAVPQLISYLDQLENQGVFRIIKATLDIRAKIASAYSPEDIDKIGDGIVALLGLAKKMSDPQALAFLEKFAELPSQVDLESAEKASEILFGKSTSESLKELSQELFLEIFEGVPQTRISREELEGGLDMIAALSAKTGFLKSNGEARRELKQSSISVNKTRVDETHIITDTDLIRDRFILLQRGKKNYFVLVVD